VHPIRFTPTDACYASIEIDQPFDLRALVDLDVRFALQALKQNPLKRYAPHTQEITQVFFGRFDGIAEHVTVNVIPQHSQGRRGGLDFIQYAQPFEDTKGGRAEEMRGERVAGEMRPIQHKDAVSPLTE